MTRERLDLGRRAEAAAEHHLRALGHEVVARNFRCAAGEIDLVTRIGDRLVFVEVRSRRGDRYGSGADSVDRRKQRRLCRVAALFLVEQGLWERCWTRFDVVGVDWRDGEPVVEHVENAFDCSD